jgi:hypothetical protein
MAVEIAETTLDERVAQIIRKVIHDPRQDAWLDAQGAADHLKISRHHFLRVCIGCLGSFVRVS